MTKRTRVEVKGSDIELLRELMFLKKYETKSKILEEIMDNIVSGKYDEMNSPDEDIMSVSLDKDKVSSARERAKELTFPTLQKMLSKIITVELENEKETTNVVSEESTSEESTSDEDEDDFLIRSEDRLK